MDRRQIATLLVLDELGITPTVKLFSNRLELQKAVYLAQAAGVKLGYYFTWYLRGPYCPALTRDVFDVIDSRDDVEFARSSWQLDDGSRRLISKIKPLIDQQSAGDDERRPRQLELLASVHYLIARDQVTRRDAQEITKRLQHCGKDFSQDEVEKALDLLRQHELIKFP